MDRAELKAPYCAVIFSYQRSKNLQGYQEMDDATQEMVKTVPGYLSHEYTGEGNEHAIFISYWKDMASIEHWKKNDLHRLAKAKGKSKWYQWYHSQICKVEHTSFSSLF